MNWLALILGLVRLAQSLADWRARTEAADGATAKVVADALNRSLDEVAAARSARQDMRADLDRGGPDRLRDDDGFRRRD
ncbi:hypothetical protein [Prosthecodimorpha staleyi]|uniref:Uncharacterized protein n=1 Tax=Prosthecodimorpha staleyi TaxID=2840188 RepID=A0A947D9K0_9HYPH|nr:hypothetical protein [Prosthecodimorpha staleyi]MBT9293320.1 hypothetical protein [Prosthecodimorpha staleyi]